MKQSYAPRNYPLIVIVILSFCISTYAQVGINTVTPGDGAMLDITATDKGILIPNVALTAKNLSSPISPEPLVSVLVYNTVNASSGSTEVFPGYYWWDGSEWISLQETREKWDLLGNTGTDEDVNFVGTTDSEALTFRTNDTERFRVANGDQVLAMANGSAAAPFYSWEADQTMGFWKSGTRQLDMVINGSTFFNANANTGGGSDLELSFNPGGVDMNLRVETDNSANSLFVSGESDNVGLGTNSPSISAQMEMADVNKGLLINRVVLSATNVAAPITTPVNGLLVYNTATASSGSTAVSPGFYYWDTTRWIAMDGSNGKDWSLSGNAGTTAGTDFLGTTDNVSLEFFTNNATRMRVEDDGQVSIGFGATGVNANQQFNVGSTFTNGTAIGAYATGSGYGLYSQNISTGFGVYSLVTNSVVSMVADNNSTSGVGVIASGANQALTYWSNAGGSFNGSSLGVTGNAKSSTGTGVSGVGNAGSVSVTDAGGSGVAGTSDSLGIFGYAGDGDVSNGNRGNAGARFVLDADFDSTTTSGNNGDRASAILAGFDNISFNDDTGGSYGTQDSYFGGYFAGGSHSSGTPSYAYVGLRYNTNGNGTSGTDFKIVGPGSNSTIIEDEKGVPRIMFSPEAPEILFQDFGVGQLVNGEARIDLDPLLRSSLHVDSEHPLKVYVTLEGECNGIYVTNKSVTGFNVKELQSGTSNVSFSWQIVASRADTRDSGGRVVSKHVGLRLPEAPGALKGRPLQQVNSEEAPATEEVRDIHQASVKKQ